MSSSSQTSVFLNIPVADLERSVKFYSALGFVYNKTFSNPGEAATMSLPLQPGTTSGPAAHSGPFKLMLLSHSFYGNFMPRDTERADPRKVAQALLCLSGESKEAVDEMAEKGVANGGEKDIREKSEMEKQMEQAGVYGRILRDPDGHIVEAMYMPPEMYVGKE